jgi:hypothetical protein
VVRLIVQEFVESLPRGVLALSSLPYPSYEPVRLLLVPKDQQLSRPRSHWREVDRGLIVLAESSRTKPLENLTIMIVAARRLNEVGRGKGSLSRSTIRLE